MRRTTVEVTHTETLYPSLPGLEIEIRYSAIATITSDDQEWEYEHRISNLKVSVNGGEWETMPVPSAQTHDGNRFLAPLREAARREARKIEEQEKEAEQPREYRHTHEQMFPKVRPISPDNDDRFYG